jgi:hypothetical protein
MNTIIKFIFFFLAFFLADSFAKEQLIHHQVRQYTDFCNNCGITKFFIDITSFSSIDGKDTSPYYGTILRAGFEADTWENLQKYAFVQYIRGCTYVTIIGPNGANTYRIGEIVKHLDKRRLFSFHEWSIDSVSKDPLYYGTPDEEERELIGGRLAYYRWTSKIGEYSMDHTIPLYELLKRSDYKTLPPRIFVIDTPSMAYEREPGEFNNVGLDFKMCIYRIEDIPNNVENDMEIPNPIVCHAWSSHFEYDNKTQRIIYHSKNQDMICRKLDQKEF